MTALMTPEVSEMSTMTEAASAEEALRGGQVVEFIEPIPGFPGERDFSLSSLDPDGLLFAMRSLRTPQLRFVVMPPAGFFPDYQPEVTEQDVAALGDVTDAELQLLVIVSVKDGISDATANLLAPIVLETGTGHAVQVVLDDPRLPLRAPLLPAAS